MTEKHIYIGASSQGATPEEKERITAHVSDICGILKSNGYIALADGGLKDKRIHKSSRTVSIPQEYHPSESVVTSLTGLRLDGNAEKLAYDIAMCNWVDDLFSKSLGCIFIVVRSNLGIGIEFLTALKIIQTQCLVLVDLIGSDGKPYPISSLVNGQTSRLLTVSRWENETIEKEVKAFLKKVESGLDRDLRFLVSTETESWLKSMAKEYDFKGVPELVRHILGKARAGEFPWQEKK